MLAFSVHYFNHFAQWLKFLLPHPGQTEANNTEILVKPCDCYVKEVMHLTSREPALEFLVARSGVPTLEVCKWTALSKPAKHVSMDADVIVVLSSGASSARVCSHGSNYGAKPSDRGQRALLSREDQVVPHVNWLYGHHYDGETLFVLVFKIFWISVILS